MADDRIDALISGGLEHLERDAALRNTVDTELFMGGPATPPKLGDFDNEWGMMDPAVAASLGVSREEMLNQIRRRP